VGAGGVGLVVGVEVVGGGEVAGEVGGKVP